MQGRMLRQAPLWCCSDACGPKLYEVRDRAATEGVQTVLQGDGESQEYTKITDKQTRSPWI